MRTSLLPLSLLLTSIVLPAFADSPAPVSATTLNPPTGYYTLEDLPKAQDAARQSHLPLAWIDGMLSALSASNPDPNSEDEITQMALAHLKSRVVVIFADAGPTLGQLPAVIRDQQLFQMDDGPLPDGHHYYVPKVCFCDAEITKPLGRVSYTQMHASREAAIDAVLVTINADKTAGYQIKIGAPGTDALPADKKQVTLASFTGAPTGGVQFDQTTDEMMDNHLSSDDVIVACDGIQVENAQQYTSVRDATDSSAMTLIVWDGKRYHELYVHQPHRKFGVQMHTYKP
jgi:hypothetical protein